MTLFQFVEDFACRPRGCGFAFLAEFVGREFNFRAFLGHRRIAVGVAGGGDGRRRELPSGSCRSGVTRCRYGKVDGAYLLQKLEAVALPLSPVFVRRAPCNENEENVRHVASFWH